MNTQIRNPHRGSDVQTFFEEEDLPQPPDNFDEFNALPEAFREKVTNQFTRGIDREHELMRDRVQAEYAVARAWQAEKDKRKANQRRGSR